MKGNAAVNLHFIRFSDFTTFSFLICDYYGVVSVVTAQMFPYCDELLPLLRKKLHATP